MKKGVTLDTPSGFYLRASQVGIAPTTSRLLQDSLVAELLSMLPVDTSGDRIRTDDLRIMNPTF